ncbi:neuropeptides capa receptor-like [Leptopilina boulardi]|uniref:neuropeptides capa receptor-like n=1 Tax=Leptopilina boulardi TaxID=63433 RepID=UPI0021F64784|nr:neuropeptides capa receptor-like [Leptopilina boulardi]
MTCIVIIKSPSLRNVTNYYLFNLAISDLLLLISGIILHLQLLWMKYFLIGGIVLCKVLPYLYDVAYKVSVLTVFAFSFERYLAICHPLSFRNVKTLKRTITSIIVLWIVGLIFSLNQLFQHLIKYVFQFSSDLIIDPENLLACDYIDKLNRYINDYLNFFIFFILPMIVITILYIKMGQKLRDSCQKNTLNYGKSCRQFQSRQSSIKMLSM